MWHITWKAIRPVLRVRLLGPICLSVLLGLLVGPSFLVGAPDTNSGTNHWAYQPVRKPSVPSVRDQSWPRTDIDRFVLATQEARGIRPNDDADPATLLRRVYFDLIGLPPAPEQVDAFTSDKSSETLPRVVDALLASPEFGESWGRHWLDVVRYAESVTLRGFVFKQAWRYRDYVIEAFNSDMPYDQFLREQIAGDLLPSNGFAEKRRRMVASTFLALGNINLEEQDKTQLRMDIVDEQLDTIGKAFLAQTIGCARCHDHKFDPIPTRDYYAMAGILRNTKTITNANVSGWLELPLPVEPEQEQIFVAYEGKVAALQDKLNAAKQEAKALAGKSADPKVSRDLNPSVVSVYDLPGIIVDSAQSKRVGEWKASQYSRHYVGDGYLHDDATGKGEKTLTFSPELKKPGRYDVRFAYQHSPSRSTAVPVTIFHADGETTVHVNEQDAPLIDGRFVSLGQFRFEANGFGYVLVANENTRGHVTADAVQFLPIESNELVNAWKPGKVEVGNGKKLRALEAELKKLQESAPKRPLVMGVREEEKIEDTYIHVRGSVHNRGVVVPRGFLQVVTRATPPDIPANQSGRRELADWIASESNPLTARVMVNRVWHWLFGAGLVRTTDNFGTAGEAPSHPELLDYLASRFVEQGWSLKKLVREIVLSRTYQLSSKPFTTSDPENRLLWRASRRRLEAENLRDAMLLISGKLDRRRGGPSFEPTISADYGFSDTDTRRSVYVPVFRNALPEIFELFDFADPSMVVGVRNHSTAAPQALFLMNHPFVREQARAAAEQVMKELTQQEDALTRVHRFALGRSPTDSEAALAKEYLASSSDPIEAWTDIIHALFASADFRFVN